MWFGFEFSCNSCVVVTFHHVCVSQQEGEFISQFGIYVQIIIAVVNHRNRVTSYTGFEAAPV